MPSKESYAKAINMLSKMPGYPLDEALKKYIMNDEE
jgi:hypothetical protein